MKTRVQKWGNSLAVRIPKSFAAEVGLGQDAEIDMTLDNGTVLLRPVRRKTESLTMLLRRVTAKNRHREVDFGPAVGKEVW